MNKTFTVFLLVGFININMFAQHIYVKGDASGNNDGTSWANAYTSLKTAIDNAAKGDSIFVAAGTYKPDLASRSVYFDLKDSVAIFGGFAGGETINQTTLDNRDFITNETILSGDLLDDDNSNVSTTDLSRDDNSYHIFYRNNTDSLTPQAILDGLIIADGNGGTTIKGGGIYILGKNIRPTFKNLTIRNCSAGDGGGVYVIAGANGKIAPTFSNVKFINNKAEDAGTNSVSSGGAMYIGGNNTNLIVDITFENVDFENNSSEGYWAMGGAIYAFIRYAGAVAFLDFDSCNFTGNTITGTDKNARGGAIWAEVLDGAEAYLEFKNILFCSNDATGLTSHKGYGGVGHFTEGINGTGVLQANFINTTIVNNSVNGSGESFYISGSNADLSFVNTIIYNDDFYTTDDGSYVSSNSLINTGDPKFVDASNCDYRLKIGSDAIGIGDGINGNNAGLYQGTGEDLPDFDYNSSEVDLGTVVIGYTSTEKNMSISATNVHNKLYLIAPDNIQLTLTSDDYSGKTDTIELTPVSEEVATTTIYYRYVPTVEGAFADSIKIEADGYSEMKPLTGNAVKSKGVYVKADATGNNDGTSWADAYTNLYDATDNSLMGDTIYVASGTFTPETSNKGNKFNIKEDVQLYGGFAGNEFPVTESVLLNRDFETNETILSGDIDGDGTSSENSYEIIYATGGSVETVIDGFTVTGSNNKISNKDYTAIRCYGGNASFRNLIMHNNRGYNRGGALYLDNGTFNVDSVEFYDNYVEGSSDQCYGGALYINNSTVNINKSYFWNNYVKKWTSVVGLIVDGGAIYSNNSDLTTTNTTFYDNTEIENFGATNTDHVHNEDGTLTTINTIFADGGLYNSTSGTSNLSYSYYHGALPTGTTDGGNNLLSASGSYINPRFVDADNGDFDLYGNSQCLNAGDQFNGKNIGYYQGNGIVFPEITLSLSTIVFDTIPTGTISVEQSYTVSGINLTGDISIYAPTGYEITLTSGDYSGTTNEILLSPTSGEVAETTIYVRFAPTSSIYYDQTIIHSCAGAETKYLNVTGQGGLIPTISISGSVNPFGEHPVNMPSYSDSYSVYGSNYYDDLYIVAPDGFELSFDYNFVENTDTLIISPNADGDIPWTEIRVRFNPSEIKEYSDSILHFTKYKQDTAKIFVTGTGTEPPSLTLNPEHLDFGSVYLGEYSDELSFTITGENLTENVDLLNNYESEMTLTSGDYSGDPGYIQLIPVDGTIDTTVYVRFQSYSIGTISSDINIQSGFLNDTVTLSANVIDEASKGIFVNQSNLYFGNVIIGEHSTESSFTVSGYNLEGDISIDAPNYFEITQTQGDYSGNTSSITLSPTTGTVDNEVIYARFSPTSLGYFSDSIVFSSPNVNNVKVFVSGTGEDESGNESIYLSEESLSFGEIAVVESSEVKSFNISGQNLTHDIVLTTSLPFEISMDAENFTGDVSEITIPLPEGEGGVGATVYVRFSPDEEADFGISLLASSGSIQQMLSLYGTGVTGSTGIDAKEQMEITVYPNPVSEMLFINKPNDITIRDIKIYDITGKRVCHSSTEYAKEAINMQDLQKGVYFIKIFFHKDTKTIRIIKI